MLKVLFAVVVLIAAAMVAGVHFRFNPAIPVFVILGFGLYMVRASADRHCRRAARFTGAQVMAYTCADATTCKTTTRTVAKIRRKGGFAKTYHCNARAFRAIPAIYSSKATGRIRCEGSSPSRLWQSLLCSRIAIHRHRASATKLPDANGSLHRAVRRRQRLRYHRAVVRGSVVRALGQAGGGRKPARRRRPGFAEGIRRSPRRPYPVSSGQPGYSWCILYDQDNTRRLRYEKRHRADHMRLCPKSFWRSPCRRRLNIDTMDQLVTLARAQPGKFNAAAANGISDFLLFGFIKEHGLADHKVPYRDIMQAPNDLAADRIQVLTTSLAVGQPLAHAGRIKVLAGHQQPARLCCARRPDRERSRLSGVDD